MRVLEEKRRSSLTHKLEVINQKLAAHDAKRVQFVQLTDWAENRLYGKPVASEKPNYSGLKREVVGAIPYMFALTATAASGIISLISLPLINDSATSRISSFLGIVFLSVAVSIASVSNSILNCGSDLVNSMKRQIYEERAHLCNEKEKLMRKLGCAGEAQEKT